MSRHGFIILYIHGIRKRRILYFIIQCKYWPIRLASLTTKSREACSALGTWNTGLRKYKAQFLFWFKLQRLLLHHFCALCQPVPICTVSDNNGSIGIICTKIILCMHEVTQPWYRTVRSQGRNGGVDKAGMLTTEYCNTVFSYSH